MNRRLWLVVSAAAVAAGGGAVLLNRVAAPAQPPATPDPVPVVVSHLPRALFERGEHRGQVVRLGFELPLTPTDDPLVWEYRPGLPASAATPTYRILFDRPPSFLPKPPHIVVGTVSHLEPDTRIRPNRVPGIVILTAAFAVAPPSP